MTGSDSWPRCARTYGDVVAIRLGPRKMILVNHPDLVEEVLVTNNRHYIKHFALRLTENTLGNGLLTSEGDFWRRQRRLGAAGVPSRPDRRARRTCMVVRSPSGCSRTWQSGEVRDVQEAMMRLTLEIIAKTLFDADVSGESAEVSAAMETVLASFTARVNSLVRLPYFVPDPQEPATSRAVNRLDTIIFEIIARRRASGRARGPSSRCS